MHLYESSSHRTFHLRTRVYRSRRNLHLPALLLGNAILRLAKANPSGVHSKDSAMELGYIFLINCSYLGAGNVDNRFVVTFPIM